MDFINICRQPACTLLSAYVATCRHLIAPADLYAVGILDDRHRVVPHDSTACSMPPIIIKTMVPGRSYPDASELEGNKPRAADGGGWDIRASSSAAPLAVGQRTSVVPNSLRPSLIAFLSLGRCIWSQRPSLWVEAAGVAQGLQRRRSSMTP